MSSTHEHQGRGCGEPLHEELHPARGGHVLIGAQVGHPPGRIQGQPVQLRVSQGAAGGAVLPQEDLRPHVAPAGVGLYHSGHSHRVAALVGAHYLLTEGRNSRGSHSGSMKKYMVPPHTSPSLAAMSSLSR